MLDLATIDAAIATFQKQIETLRAAEDILRELGTRALAESTSRKPAKQAVAKASAKPTPSPSPAPATLAPTRVRLRTDRADTETRVLGALRKASTPLRSAEICRMTTLNTSCVASMLQALVAEKRVIHTGATNNSRYALVTTHAPKAPAFETVWTGAKDAKGEARLR